MKKFLIAAMVSTVALLGVEGLGNPAEAHQRNFIHSHHHTDPLGWHRNDRRHRERRRPGVQLELNIPGLGGSLQLGVPRARRDARRVRRHVRWCSRQYRSYDRYSDTYVTYTGRIRRCRSPYLR